VATVHLTRAQRASGPLAASDAALEPFGPTHARPRTVPGLLTPGRTIPTSRAASQALAARTTYDGPGPASRCLSERTPDGRPYIHPARQERSARKSVATSTPGDRAGAALSPQFPTFYLLLVHRLCSGWHCVGVFVSAAPWSPAAAAGRGLLTGCRLPSAAYLALMPGAISPLSTRGMLGDQHSASTASTSPPRPGPGPSPAPAPPTPTSLTGELRPAPPAPAH